MRKLLILLLAIFAMPAIAQIEPAPNTVPFEAICLDGSGNCFGDTAWLTFVDENGNQLPIVGFLHPRLSMVSPFPVRFFGAYAQNVIGSWVIRFATPVSAVTIWQAAGQHPENIINDAVVTANGIATLIPAASFARQLPDKSADRAENGVGGDNAYASLSATVIFDTPTTEVIVGGAVEDTLDLIGVTGDTMGAPVDVNGPTEMDCFEFPVDQGTVAADAKLFIICSVKGMDPGNNRIVLSAYDLDREPCLPPNAVGQDCRVQARERAKFFTEEPSE